MIKKIIVVPRLVVEHNIEELKYCSVISIYSTPKEKLFGYEDNVLSLLFSDIDKDVFDECNNGPHELYLFSEEQAQQILNFVSITKFSPLVVHCDAGISRSGAVGLFINRYLKLDETEFRNTNPQIYPNPYVLEILNKVSGINNDYEKFWQTTVDPTTIF